MEKIQPVQQVTVYAKNEIWGKAEKCRD